MTALARLVAAVEAWLSDECGGIPITPCEVEAFQALHAAQAALGSEMPDETCDMHGNDRDACVEHDRQAALGAGVVKPLTQNACTMCGEPFTPERPAPVIHMHGEDDGCYDKWMDRMFGERDDLRARLQAALGAGSSPECSQHVHLETEILDLRNRLQTAEAALQNTQADYGTRDAQATALAAALAQYGQHKVTCQQWPCDCGLDAATRVGEA